MRRVVVRTEGGPPVSEQTEVCGAGACPLLFSPYILATKRAAFWNSGLNCPHAPTEFLPSVLLTAGEAHGICGVFYVYARNPFPECALWTEATGEPCSC